MKYLLAIVLGICTLALVGSTIYIAGWTDKGSEVWGWLLFVGLLFAQGTGRSIYYIDYQEKKIQKKSGELMTKFNRSK